MLPLLRRVAALAQRARPASYAATAASCHCCCSCRHYTSPHEQQQQQQAMARSRLAFRQYMRQQNRDYVAHDEHDDATVRLGASALAAAPSHDVSGGDDNNSSDHARQHSSWRHTMQSWHVRPTLVHDDDDGTTATASSVRHGARERRRGASLDNNDHDDSRRRRNSSTRDDTTTTTAAAATSRHAPPSTRRVVQHLRHVVAAHTHACAQTHMWRDVQRTVRILRDAEHALTQRIQQQQQQQQQDALARPLTSSSALEGVVFERVGQLQRTLRQLTPHHYRHLHSLCLVAPCHTPQPRDERRRHVNDNSSNRSSSSNDDDDTPPSRAAALRALLQLTCACARVLHTLQYTLPRCFGGSGSGASVSGEQARTHARTTGALYVVREAVTALVRADATVSSSSSSQLLLSPRAVLAMLRAVLSLPSADSPRVTLPVYTQHAHLPYLHNNDNNNDHNNASASSLLPSSSSRVSCTMSVEEWCVRRCLSVPRLRIVAADDDDDNNNDNDDDAAHRRPSQRSSRRRHAALRSSRVMTLRQAMYVLRCCTCALVDDAATHSGRPRRVAGDVGAASLLASSSSSSSKATRALLRIPYGVGKAYTEWLLTQLQQPQPRPLPQARRAHNAACVTRAAAATTTTTTLSACMSARDTALLCAALLFYECYTHAALDVLVRAAPQCARAVDTLSGADLASVLLTYSTLRYSGDLSCNTTNATAADEQQQQQQQQQQQHSPSLADNFYVVLGTRVGQIADTMHDDDLTRVLQALSRAGVAHDTLRHALQSSMRMRRVYQHAATYRE